MPTVFELKKNTEDLFYFHFVDGKGELIMMSGDYPEKEAAEKAIQDVRVGSLMSNQIAASKVPEGDAFFVIKDAEGQILAKSVLFSSTMLFDNALHAVKDNACIAEINDMTA